MVINGKHTGRLGVEDLIGPPGEKLACTNLERTLIDIVVRPSYAGGATQVARAYRNAMHRVSVTRLCAILNELAYAYPYHQAIGFLMQHVGYPPHAHELLRAIPSEFDFYLEHDLRDQAYNSYWKIYFPRDLSPASASNH